MSQDAKDWLIEEGYDEELGARPLRRIVEQQVRDKITDYYLDHTDVKHVDLDIEDNELVVKVNHDTLTYSVSKMSIRTPSPVLIFKLFPRKMIRCVLFCSQQSRSMSHVPHFPCFERLKNLTNVYKAYPKIAKN